MNDQIDGLPEELSESIKILLEKQNAQYTDIMFLLKSIEEKLSVSEVQVRTDDDLYEEAKDAVVEAQVASTSYLQRILGIGYSRASHMMDLLEVNGIVSKAQGSKPRKVLIQKED